MDAPPRFNPTTWLVHVVTVFCFPAKFDEACPSMRPLSSRVLVAPRHQAHDLNTFIATLLYGILVELSWYGAKLGGLQNMLSVFFYSATVFNFPLRPETIFH